MTTALAISLPGVCIACTDTRITIKDGAGNVAALFDGPGDQSLEVESPRMSLHFPRSQRKLRQVGTGWVASCGDYFSNQRMLARLQRSGRIHFEEAVAVLRAAYPEVRDEIARTVGFPIGEIEQSTFLGAPHSQEGGCWAYQLSGAVEVPTKPSHVMNWPLAAPVEAKVLADRRFQDEAGEAHARQSIPRLVRAALHLAHEGSKHGAESGPFAQLGITVPGASMYVEGAFVELLALNDAALLASFRPSNPESPYFSIAVG